MDFSLRVQVPGRPPLRKVQAAGGYAHGLSKPFVDRSLNQCVVRNCSRHWTEKSPAGLSWEGWPDSYQLNLRERARWLVTEGEQTSSASAWLYPQLLRTGKRPQHGQGAQKALAGEGTEGAAMQGPATCNAARKAVAASSGRGCKAGAAYPELPSHVSNTAALMSHSCKDNDRIGERSKQDGTRMQHNTVPCISQVATPHGSSSSLGPRPVQEGQNNEAGEHWTKRHGVGHRSV